MALLGLSPTAVRVLPALEMGLVVVLVALMARDLGGSRRAQVLAAITAALSGYLAAGHFDATASPTCSRGRCILWLLVKLLAGGDRRLWLAVGVVAGIGLENKDTLLFLGAGLLSGSSLARRWDVLRSPLAWAAVGIALLLWAPNLAWQATNGWPQLTMAPTIGGYAGRQPRAVPAVPVAVRRSLLFAVSLAGWAWMLLREGGMRRGGRSGSPPSSCSSSWWPAAARPTTRSASSPRSWPRARSSSTAGSSAATRGCGR